MNENSNGSGGGEIDYSVRVALRTRPLSQKEINERSEEVMKYADGSPQVIIGKDQTFTFDYVFPPRSKQAEIFEECVYPLVESFFEGYNSTILAYGQTGSGKTYTMGSATTVGIDPEEMGVIPRVIDLVFDKVEKKMLTHQMVVKVSFLELYNEEIKDMLNTIPTPGGLPIREKGSGEVYIPGLVEEVVRSRKQMEDALIRGSSARTTGSTLMNFHSSRSHAIFSIILEQTGGVGGTSRSLVGNSNGSGGDSPPQAEPDTDEKNPTIRSMFHFVDLAGSERVKKTQAEGQRLKEGININSGLLALGNVISALGDTRRANKAKHIPYRDSKLTRMLQSSLGGNSRTLMIACTSPADSNFEETLNTLKYAYRARNIMNKPIVNVDPTTKQLLMYKQQIQLLKDELLKCTCKDQAQVISNILNNSSNITITVNNEQSATPASRDKERDRDREREKTPSDPLKASSNAINNDEMAKLNFDLNMKVSQMEFENNMLQEISNKVNSKYKGLLKKYRLLEDLSYNFTNNFSPNNESSYYSDYFEQLNGLLNGRYLVQEGQQDEETEENQMVEQFEQNSEELYDLNQFITEKEEELELISKSQQQFQQMKEQYDCRLKELEGQLETMKEEREKEMSRLNEQEKPSDDLEAEKQRITKHYEKKLTELKNELEKHQRSIREMQRNQESKTKITEQVDSLQSEIKDMKKQKTDLLKKMRDELKKKDEEKQLKSKELDQLKKEARKSEVLIVQLKNQSKKKDMLLQKKTDESELFKKKLKDIESAKQKLLNSRASATVATNKRTTTTTTAASKKSTPSTVDKPYKPSSSYSSNDRNWREWLIAQITKNLEKNQVSEKLEKQREKKESLVRESNESRKSFLNGSLKISKQEYNERSSQLETLIKKQNETISKIQKDLVSVSNECLDTSDILQLVSHTSFEKLPNLIQSSLELCIEYADLNRKNTHEIVVLDDGHDDYYNDDQLLSQRIQPSTLKETIRVVNDTKSRPSLEPTTLEALDELQKSIYSPTKNNNNNSSAGSSSKPVGDLTHALQQHESSDNKEINSSTELINGEGDDLILQDIINDEEMINDHSRFNSISESSPLISLSSSANSGASMSIDTVQLQDVVINTPPSPRRAQLSADPDQQPNQVTTDSLAQKLSSLFDQMGKKDTALNEIITPPLLVPVPVPGESTEDHSVFDRDLLEVDMPELRKPTITSTPLISTTPSSFLPPTSGGNNNSRYKKMSASLNISESPLVLSSSNDSNHSSASSGMSHSLNPSLLTPTPATDVFTRLSGPRPESRLKNYRATNYISSVQGRGKEVDNNNNVTASWTFAGHDGSVYGLLVDQSKLLYSCGQDKLIKCWDFTTGDFISDMPGHTGAVKSMVCSSNSLMFSGGADKSVRIWDIRSPTNTFKKSLKVTADVLCLASFNNLVVGGMENGWFKVWDIRSMKSLITPISKKQFHSGSIFSMSVSSKYLITGSRDHTINTFHKDSLDIAQNLYPHHYDGVSSIYVGPDDTMYSGSRDKSIKKWELALPSLSSSSGSNSGFSTSSTGSNSGFLSTNSSNPLKLSSESIPSLTNNSNNNNNNNNNNSNSSNPIYQQSKILNNAHNDWINSLIIFNNHLYSGGRDSTIKGWDSQLTSHIQLVGHESAINCLVSSRDMILSGSNDKSIKLWKPIY